MHKAAAAPPAPIAPKSAEAIADITSSGDTLRANHLKTLEDGLILRSQATLFRARTDMGTADRQTLKQLVAKLGVD